MSAGISTETPVLLVFMIFLTALDYFWLWLALFTGATVSCPQT